MLTSVTYIHRFVALFVCSSSDRAQPCSQVVGTNMRKLHSFQVCSHFWYIFGVARRLSKGVNPQVLSPVCLFQDGKQAGRCTGSMAIRHWLSPRPLSSLTYLLVLVSVRAGIGALKGQRALSKRTARKRVLGALTILRIWRQQRARCLRDQQQPLHQQT